MDLRHKHWAVIFVGILIAAFVAVAAWYAFGTRTAVAPSTETGTSTPGTATTTPAATAEPAHITEHAQYYDIDLAYPAATPLASVSAAADARAVAAMKGEMQTIATQFKQNGDFANLTPEDVKLMRLDERKEALSAEYKMHASANTVSYVFQVYEDTLGAHPNTYFRTFTFDTATGAELSLADIFAAGAPYLQALSEIARAKLPPIVAQHAQVSVSEVDTDYIADGTTPATESFQTWYIDTDTLTIVFPPYQVGPYALGTIELPLPLSSLPSVKSGYSR